MESWPRLSDDQTWLAGGGGQGEGAGTLRRARADAGVAPGSVQTVRREDVCRAGAHRAARPLRGGADLSRRTLGASPGPH